MDKPIQHMDETLRRALAELEAVKTPAELEAFRIKYLGSKGEIKNLTDLIAKVSKEQKREVGQKANAAKATVQTAFEAKQSHLAAVTPAAGGVAEDVTEPGLPPSIGN